MTALTGLHLRASRALLRWRVQDLARKSRVNIDTIKRVELLDGPVNMPEQEQAALIRVLEMAGIALVDDPSLGIGAAYTKTTGDKRDLIG